MPTLYKSQVHDAFKEGAPLRKDVTKIFKKVTIEGENGERVHFDHLEDLIKYLEDMFFNGTTLSMAEKKFIEDGISGGQWENRVELMRIINAIKDGQKAKRE